MRDFRDAAAAMAHTLRDALQAKAVETTHSECLELIAKAFGDDNWNILSARIDAAAAVRRGKPARRGSPQRSSAATRLLYCSFCGKRPARGATSWLPARRVFICDECVDLCTDIIDEATAPPDAKATTASARAMSTDRLLHYVEHASKGEQRNRLVLQRIERMLAFRHNAGPVDDDT